MAESMAEMNERILWFRDRAEECRTIRDGFKDAQCRFALAVVAKEWDAMADTLERLAARASA